MPEPIEEKVTGDNIFEDFVSNESLGEEIKTIDKQQQKDAYYYLSIGNVFLKIINLLLFVVIVLFYGYSYIQNKEEEKQYDILEPICNIFLGESSDKIEGCFGVKYQVAQQTEKFEELKSQQQKDIWNIIPDVYTVENFTNSEGIIFLLTKTEEKAQYIKILSEFDRLKNTFASTDRSRIECSNIVINKDLEVEIECDVYSTDWDKSINDIDKTLTRTGGTSITIASLFIEFLDRDQTFSLLDKQKSFETRKVEGKGYFSRGTDVKLKMRYNKLGNLSF